MFLLGIIVSLCYIPGLTGAFIATQWPVLSILLPLSLWRVAPATPFHWLWLLFVAYGFVRLRYAPIFQDGVYGLWLVCIMGLSFWLGSTSDGLRRLYAGLAVGASVSSVIAIFQFFGYSVVPYVTSSPAGLYVNSVAQGLVLALLVVALATERMWLWVPLLVPGLVLSSSRGAWLALAVGLISVHVRRVWVLGLVAVAGACFVAMQAPSDNARLFIWNAAATNLTWAGWGPGSFFSWLLWYGDNTLYPEYAHNDALQLAFEYGIGAALPIGILAWALTRTTEREWPILVAFVTAGCYSMALWVPVVSFLAWVVAGRLVRSWAVVRSDSDSRRWYVVPWRWCAGKMGGGFVSVVAHS